MPPTNLKMKTHLRDPFCPRNFFGWGGEALCIKSAPMRYHGGSGCWRPSSRCSVVLCRQ